MKNGMGWVAVSSTCLSALYPEETIPRNPFLIASIMIEYKHLALLEVFRNPGKVGSIALILAEGTKDHWKPLLLSSDMLCGQPDTL